MTRGTRWALVAAGVYLAAAAWHVRAVLPAPATLLLTHPSWERDPIARGDQSIVVAAIAWGARTLVTEPARLYDGGQCFPMPHALTLGEHLIGNSILGILPYWLSGGEPIFATNAVYVLELWIAAIAMYALVLYWTGSFGAALIAGFLFGFLPSRLQDPGHPFLHGNQWTPLVLLFTHRVFVGGRWRDALALTLFAGLQALESFYMIWAMTVLLVVFGIGLSLRNRTRLPRVAPLLLVGTAMVGGLMWVTMKPYLDTNATWGILDNRGGGFLLFGSEVMPGGHSYPGSVSLILAGIALLDRMRGRRSPDDPRWLFLAMGFVMVWAVLGSLPLPFVGPVPSLTTILMNVVPGLSAGRGIRTARLGIYVVTSFLAAYGVVALTAGRSRLVRAAIFTIVGAAAVFERFAPSYAATQFHFSTGLIAREARPPDALLALFREFPRGAVLDVPDTFGTVSMLRDHAHYTFLGAYHHRQTGSCYNSNSVPISADVAALAAQLPRPPAVDALHSLGFRTLVVHGESLGPHMLTALLGGLDALVATGQLERIGDVDRHWAYAIIRGGKTASGQACLEPLDLRPPLELSGPSAKVPFAFRSRWPDRICRQPDPLAPTNVVVHWRERSENRTVTTQSTRILLPIAVSSGPALERKVPLELPPEGSYLVFIAPEADQSRRIAQRNVDVVRPPVKPSRP